MTLALAFVAAAMLLGMVRLALWGVGLLLRHPRVGVVVVLAVVLCWLGGTIGRRTRSPGRLAGACNE